MLHSFLDNIGDWNPQVLRELKGQLKPIKLGLAIALSIITQVIFIGINLQVLPGNAGQVPPKRLNLTTYPQLSVISEGNGEALMIQSLGYDAPMEVHPSHGDYARSVDQVKVGDRILAIDGVDLYAIADQSPQALYQNRVNGPFDAAVADRYAYAPTNKTAATTLRQKAAGTPLHLTLERDGQAEPFTVEIPRIITSPVSSRYCLRLNENSGQAPQRQACQAKFGATYYYLNWQPWHQESFYWLNVITFFPLLIWGSYSIITNLLKEARTGTLNFLRLSPQSAWTILGGKILGVPGLAYLAVLLSLPLNLFHGLSSGISWGLLLGFYLTTPIILFLCFSVAVLVGMLRSTLGVLQAWLGTGILFLGQYLSWWSSHTVRSGDENILAWPLLFSPFSILRLVGQEPFISRPHDDVFHWMGIPMNAALIVIFVAVNALLWSRWVWLILDRRFFNPTQAHLSKAQSYGLVLLLNGSAIGFMWPTLSFSSQSLQEDFLIQAYERWLENHLLSISLLNLGLWLLLVIALSPQRQALHDWARYRHLIPTTHHSHHSSSHLSQPSEAPLAESLPSRHRHSLWSDLLWAEKSPMVGAIALNLVMMMGLLLLWLGACGLMYPEHLHPIKVALVSLVACVNLMLIGATLAQFIFFYREKQAPAIALFMLLMLLIAVPAALGASGLAPDTYPTIFLAFFPWATTFFHLPPIGISMAILVGQWLGLGLLNWQLMRSIRTIGESDSKQLLKAKLS